MLQVDVESLYRAPLDVQIRLKNIKLDSAVAERAIILFDFQSPMKRNKMAVKADTTVTNVFPLPAREACVRIGIRTADGIVQNRQ